MAPSAFFRKRGLDATMSIFKKWNEFFRGLGEKFKTWSEKGKFSNGSRKFRYNFKFILEEEKKRIEEELKEIELKVKKMRPFYLDYLEGGEIEVSFCHRAYLVLCLANIETALAEWERGRYGRCLICREQIPEKELIISPEAIYCVGCQTIYIEIETRKS